MPQRRRAPVGAPPLGRERSAFVPDSARFSGQLPAQRFGNRAVEPLGVAAQQRVRRARARGLTVARERQPPRASDQECATRLEREARVIERVHRARERGRVDDAERQCLVHEQRGQLRDLERREGGAEIFLREAALDPRPVARRLLVAEAQQQDIGAVHRPDRHVIEDRRVGAQHELDRRGAGLVEVVPLAIHALRPRRTDAAPRAARDRRRSARSGPSDSSRGRRWPRRTAALLRSPRARSRRRSRSACRRARRALPPRQLLPRHLAGETREARNDGEGEDDPAHHPGAWGRQNSPSGRE